MGRRLEQRHAKLPEDDETVRGPADPSIFCFAVVSPGTYEPELVALQYQQGSGIFGCDGYTVVSNVSATELFNDSHADGRINVSVVDANLWVKLQQGPPGWDPSSPWKGTQKHLVNAPVFVKVWDKIFRDGEFRKYDWTLKLDADAFIVPMRLRTLLAFYTQHPSSSLYLLNSARDMYGNFLHGPVEALTKAAMEVYKSGAEKCKKEVDTAGKGEDWYLGLCLQHLAVRGVKELRLLEDAYMWGSRHVSCDTPFATFHPLKSIDEWERCLKQVCPTSGNPWAYEVMYKYGVQPEVSAATAEHLQLAFPGPTCAFLAVALLGSLAVAWRRRSAPSAGNSGEGITQDREPCLAGGDAEDAR